MPKTFLFNIAQKAASAVYNSLVYQPTYEEYVKFRDKQIEDIDEYIRELEQKVSGLPNAAMATETQQKEAVAAAKTILQQCKKEIEGGALAKDAYMNKSNGSRSDNYYKLSDIKIKGMKDALEAGFKIIDKQRPPKPKRP